MASLYDSVKTAEELLKEVAAHGLSTKAEDICRVQDIFGRTTVEELVRLANDNGRLKEFNGEPDPRGPVSSGRDGLSRYFYQVAFQIWNWEDATRFYNQHSNFPVIDAMAELDWLRKDKKELAEMLDVAKDTMAHEREMRVSVEVEKRNAQKEIDRLEAEVHDRDMTIMELKAKLYDLMAEKEEK